jgi:hypothetical protein
VCDLPFSTLRDLLSGIEAFLADTPEAVEEADDFAVNFAFAAEEGIDISSAFASPARDAAASRDPHPGPAVLPGYAPVAPGAGRPRPFPGAVLRIDASGEALVILDTLAPPGDIATPKVLLRDDGLGFAVHRQAAEGDARPPYALRLPAGCLPGAIERLACDIPLVASERADHLLFTPLPEFATRTTAPYPPLGTAPADARASPHTASRPVEAAAAWRRVRGIAAATAIAMLAGAVLLASAQTPALPPETPVDALRAGLFRTAP